MTARLPASPAQARPTAAAVARLLRAASLVLALLFLLQVLRSLAPWAAGPLALALSFTAAMISAAPLAVLVPCLVALAELIDEPSRLGRRFGRLARSLALPVALGYLLLIPLHASALWSRSHAEARALDQGLRGSLERLDRVRGRVLRAASSAELEPVLAALPSGSPPLARFGADLPSRRSALLDFLDQVRRILASRRQGLQQQLLLRFLRDLALFALACLGLAVLFLRSSCLSLPLRRRGQRADPPRQPRSARAQLDHDLGVLLAQCPSASHPQWQQPAADPAASRDGATPPQPESGH
jgi:hypothetical protein